MEVAKDDEKLLTVEAGQVFGEATLLYDCVHPYSISALTNSKLWAIDRRSFQTLMMRSALNSLSRSMELLCSVPFLKSLPEDVLMKMSDVLEEAHYAEGDYIIRQGASGDTFYIISRGQVKVTEKKGSSETLELSTLSPGHWFGEKALRGDAVRAVSVVAATDVTCLVIERESFRKIIGGVVDDRDDVPEGSESKARSEEDTATLSNTTLSDYQVVCNLGVGEIGHTVLVRLQSSGSPFALRVIRKQLLSGSGRQEHVLRERQNLAGACCPFIVRLHRTFRDARCVYLLTEACLGGELGSLLRDRERFDDHATRFYTACVVEALVFLHGRGIVCRDLKPGNVVLDQRGYAKLMGLGCSKKVGSGKKTWTLCGTPGYMAPEVILNQGHSASADLWSLGVFVFELLSGSLPFCGPDPMGTFSATLRGIDLVEFPKTIGRNASSLIKKLCRTSPSERLGNQRNGAKDIQKHKWFEGFNWEGLTKGSLTPPVLPKLNSHLEKSKVDHVTDDLEEPPGQESDWDKDF